MAPGKFWLLWCPLLSSKPFVDSFIWLPTSFTFGVSCAWPDVFVLRLETQHPEIRQSWMDWSAALHVLHAMFLNEVFQIFFVITVIFIVFNNMTLKSIHIVASSSRPCHYQMPWARWTGCATSGRSSMFWWSIIHIMISLETRNTFILISTTALGQGVQQTYESVAMFPIANGMVRLQQFFLYFQKHLLIKMKLVVIRYHFASVRAHSIQRSLN